MHGHSSRHSAVPVEIRRQSAPAGCGLDDGKGFAWLRLLDFDETVPGFPLPTVDDRTFMPHMEDAFVGKEFMEADVSNGIIVDDDIGDRMISSRFVDVVPDFAFQDGIDERGYFFFGDEERGPFDSLIHNDTPISSPISMISRSADSRSYQCMMNWRRQLTIFSRAILDTVAP